MLNFDVLKKYDKQGPRYTSYPPVPIFSKNFTAEDFKNAVIKNNLNNSSDISFYFHIPFCATLCYFCACNMLVSKDFSQIVAYIDLLIKEIEMVKRILNRSRKIGQLHLGGGSPSYLPSAEIYKLMSFIKTNFCFSDGAEIGIEIDPRDCSTDDIKFLSEIGFNRISIGVQDFNSHIQKVINRIQPVELTASIVESARICGFKSINIDLIYGLPFQTSENFSQTIDEVIKISPDRIALFNFAYLPQIKKHQKIFKPESLPPSEEKLKILNIAVEKLMGSGYEYIGMDHFAKPNEELSIAQKNGTLHRNFQGYSTKANLDLYAYGITAISFVENCYAQNVKSLSEYQSAVESNKFPTSIGHQLNEDDIIRKYVISRLMCQMSVSKMEFYKRFGVKFDQYFKTELQNLKLYEEDGLLINNASGINVRELGKFVIRNIAMCFDKYSQIGAYKETTFSKTI